MTAAYLMLGIDFTYAIILYPYRFYPIFYTPFKQDSIRDQIAARLAYFKRI